MSKVRKSLRPLVREIPVSLVKYYDVVGGFMVGYMKGRHVQVIVQRSEGIRLMRHIEGKPITINDVGDIKSLASQGGLDFMASVMPPGQSLIDTLIVDIKAKQQLFNRPEGYVSMHVLANAVKLGLVSFDVSNSLVYFDGMNGFKVLAKLSKDYWMVLNDASRLLKIVIDASLRAFKRFGSYAKFLNSITLGINTMSKVKVFRVPFSMHWSTKLSAIPIKGGCIKNFSTMSSEPVNVIANIGEYAFAGQISENKIDLSWLGEEDYVLAYRVKSYILSNLRLEC